MSDITDLVANNLDIWTSATQRKSGAGRGGGKRISLYGIERLRALILDLAVRGKLVPQDAGDEQAGELLKRIAKARRLKMDAGLARKLKSIDPLPKELEALPTGWEWTQLGIIAEISPGNSADDDLNVAFVPMTLVSTSFSGEHELQSRKWGDVKKGFTHFAEGDIGLAKITPCFENGKAAIFQNLPNGIGAGTTELHVARPWSDELNRRYLLLTMKTGSYLANGEKRMTGTAGQKRVTRSYFKATPLSLPPLAEQRRIVAKVDELMTLCDALERESADTLAAHQALVEELLATLVNSADAFDLATNWARMESHFDSLFTTEASIHALKQTILDLAVLGKLVEQDVRDAPASELVDSWRKAKRKALQSAGDRRIKPSADANVPPFPLPSHWAFQSFENVFLFIDYRGNTPPKTAEGVPLITAKNVRMGHIDREPREFVTQATYEKWMTRGFPNIGDLFFTTEAPLGNICQNDIDEPFAIAQRVICFQPYGAANTRFLMLAIMSRSMQRVLDDHATGMTAKGIKAAKLKPLPLPIPPLAEQHRIVAKVDSLVALCDTLKARLAEVTQTQCHLADVITEKAIA